MVITRIGSLEGQLVYPPLLCVFVPRLLVYLPVTFSFSPFKFGNS
jgi:hypothetical protein